MARTVRDAKLESRTARSSIPADNKIQWRSIHSGLHLGYRKGKRGGRWLARVYDQQAHRYAVKTIGTADDMSDADGIRVFSWSQAQAQARTLSTSLAASASGKHVGPYTVADAMDDYHRRLDNEGRSSGDSRRRTELYITPALGNIKLSELDSERLREWLLQMAEHPGFNQLGQPKPKPSFDKPEDENEYQRRRRDSANRVLSVLKAGLNEAFLAGKVQTNVAWAGKRVKPFSVVSKARVAYLNGEEVRRLVNACEPGFRELVQGAIYTGARYGDLCRMNVGDFNLDRGLVMSGNSKGSKPHPVYLNSEGVEFFRRHTAGRNPREPMFEHPETQRWNKSQQLRPMKKAAKIAGVDISFHGLRHTYASHAVMNGVPLLVVAQNLGHSDTRMVEKHYGHLADSYVRDAVRQLGPTWGIDADDKVVAIR